MKKILFSVCMLCMAAVAMAQGDALKSKIVEDGGQGPYKAIMTEVPGLQAHTVFVSQDLSKFGKKNPLPVLVWGNGACTNSPWEHYKFLNLPRSDVYHPAADREHRLGICTEPGQVFTLL